jgi:arylsulfatase A
MEVIMSNNIDRRKFLRTAATSALAAPFFISSAIGAATGRKPNIVFIMADDLGLRHLGCYGGKQIRTPNIDRLAAEGIRFTETYAGCTVCAPSRRALMTGKHNGHASVRANSGGISMRDEDFTLAEVLKEAGYATGGFGKWGLGEFGTAGVPYKQGFDEFVGYYQQTHAHFYYPEYLWKNDVKWPLLGNQIGGRLPGDAQGQRTQYAPDEILDHALHFIRANADRPFFCYVPTIIPHVELAVPLESAKEYEGAFGKEEPYKAGPYGRRLGHYCPETPMATYAAMITHMDKNVGKILNLLKELNLEDDTIVFFTSDNGAQGSEGKEFFEKFEPMKPYRGMKGSMYEGNLRVPMIARWPGHIKPATVDDKTIWYFPDVVPTLAELAGASVLNEIDGISIVPALLGRKQAAHDYLYWELPNRWARPPRQALRMGDWKAVREYHRGELELFNLANDPSETKNLAKNEPEVMKKINRILATCRTEPMPQVEPKRVKGRYYF